MITCPYCKESNDDPAVGCASCGQEFPWIPAYESLRDLVKEREVGRYRATMTLIEDALDSLGKRKPLPLSSLKGFVFARMFGRTFIVIGSIG